MKSDREFLDGIYKKASIHQKNEQNTLINKEKTFCHKGYKILRPVLVAGMALVLICSGIYAYDLGVIPFSTKSSDINREGFNITPQIENHEMVRGVGQVALGDNELPQEIIDAMKEGIVIRGRVSAFLENESFDLDEIMVDINKVYSGKEKAGTVLKVDCRNESLSTYSYNQLTRTKDILLYLKKDESNQYSLAHKTYGIFSFYEQVDGFDIFIGEDSVKLNTKIFTENVK